MRTQLLWFLSLVTFIPLASAADWPGFRGPSADGISPERGINKEWNQRVPKTLWKVALSDSGYAAPAVANGRLYVVDHEGTDDVVRAFDTATGKEIWRFAYPDAEKNRYGFTVSTPLIVDGKVYVTSRKGKIHCLQAATGEKIWSRDVKEEYHGTPPPWDYCMSPVVDKQALLLGVSGSNAAMVALNKDTGEPLWQAGNYRISYATPLIVTLNGKKQYIVFGEDALYSIAPDTGLELWQVPWPTKYGGKKGPTPVLVGDRIFAATTEGGDTGVIDLASGAPTVVWKHKEMQDHFTSPIYYHTRIYGSSEPNWLVCLDPATGKILWKQDTGQHSSVIGIDDTVIVLSGKSGELIMVDAASADFKELGRFTPLGGSSWAPLIIADGRLYVRNQKELACVELK